MMLTDSIKMERSVIPHRKMPQNSFPLYNCPKQNNNQDIKRPLKNNQNDLSFKGLSFSGENDNSQKPKKPINPTIALLGIIAVTAAGLRMAPSYKLVGKFKISELNEFFDKYNKSIKPIGQELIENLKNNKFAQKMVKISGDEISISKKTIPQLIWDGLKYPFTILPADLLNGFVELTGKIKPFKKWSERILQKQFFKDIRQRSKIDAKVNSLQGLFQTKSDFLNKLAKNEITEAQISSELHQRSVKMFDTLKYGAYDTKHERALNRLVSGLPPAIFLANDAYNLSRVLDDDPQKADKEKKTRFKQETARILSSGYLTLITLGALNKYINNSKAGIMLMTGSTVLVTEAFSRLINGKHIKRLKPEEARAENNRNNTPEKNIKPDMTFKANETKQSKTDVQKPLLSFDTLLKASGIVIGLGFAIKGLKKVRGVDELLKTIKKPFSDFYKKITVTPDYTITRNKFDEIIKVLKNNGFDELAEKYNTTAKLVEKDGIIHLGAKDKRFIKPAVNFVIAPFKFMYNAVTLPYRYVDKAIKAFAHKGGKGLQKAITPEELSKKDIEVLSKTIESIGKKALDKNLSPKEFQSYVKDNILKAFNVTTMSNVSNAELSNLAKTAATAATLWFLMTDNYNMVMLKSNGNDVNGAETKFKERFVQEISRLFYQTLLIDLFNSTFRSQYNASLLGMSLVTVADTTLGEVLTRKSVGMPTGTHSRQELEQIEKQQNEATGFLKGYYNFMRKLTGKRSIESYHVKSEEPKQNIVPPNLNFVGAGNTCTKMIKG